MPQTRLPGITRRAAVRRACGLVAPALALGCRAGAEVSSVTQRLSTYMSQAGARALPDDVVEKAKQHILDTVAAMVSGAELPPARIAMKFARVHAGEKTATIVGANVLCGAIEAALVNGMLAHSDETDDSHAPSQSHPGCAVVPAALAAGEEFGISGVRLIRAVTLGYDVGPRVTKTLGSLRYQMETHHSTHSMSSNFGAAAAAGCAASLDATQMRWLLDYAAQQASGIAAWERDTEHIEKSLVFAGMPARNGVTAALLVQLGGSGVEDIFSGPDNFLMTFGPKADAEGLVDRLGERYEIAITNLKKWTVGSPIQAPLDALETMMKKRRFTADQVAKAEVRVATSEANTVNNRDMPNICLQHMVAVMLLDHTVSFAAAHDNSRLKDAAVLRVRAKVQLIPDEDLERLYPKRVASVELTMTDGTKMAERVEAVRGTAENPMTHDEVAAKAADLMKPRLGGGRTARLIDGIWNLEKVKDVRDLRPLLQSD